MEVNVGGGMRRRQLIAAFIMKFVDVFGHTQPDARSLSFELALPDNKTMTACWKGRVHPCLQRPSFLDGP